MGKLAPCKSHGPRKSPWHKTAPSCRPKRKHPVSRTQRSLDEPRYGRSNNARSRPGGPHCETNWSWPPTTTKDQGELLIHMWGASNLTNERRRHLCLHIVFPKLMARPSLCNLNKRLLYSLKAKPAKPRTNFLASLQTRNQSLANQYNRLAAMKEKCETLGVSAQPCPASLACPHITDSKP